MGLASEKNSNLASNVASIAVSSCLGFGFFRIVLNTNVNYLVSMMVTTGEQAFANQYLTGELNKRVNEINILYDKYKEHLDKTTQKRLKNFCQQVTENPKMPHYVQAYKYKQLFNDFAANRENMISMHSPSSF